MLKEYDVIIVGAGVTGSLIARALSRYELQVLLLEKEADVGEGTTKANTAIIHAGYDAKPGTLKADLNAAGNAMFDRLCDELDVEFDRCGTYVVGVQEEDRATLEDLYRRGVANGVPGLSLLSAQELLRREPSLTPDTVGALYAATGGIVDPFGLCIAAAENAVRNGVEILLETEVTGFIRDGECIKGVETNRGSFRSKWVIIAAGVFADDLMHKAGVDDFAITPRRGQYYVLDKVAAEHVHSVLFPCPTSVSKGILVTRTIHGNVMIGPNAEDIDDKEDLATTAEGLSEVLEGGFKLVPSLDRRMIIRTFSGLRPSGNTGDFKIEVADSVKGLVLAAGIESPGLSASPAIADYVVGLLREAGQPMVERSDYDPTRKAIPRFSLLTRAEQQALIAKDPRWGRVICRCEMVTEAEIVAACHSVIPARTYDAVKRRTRLGTGRCQGSFDTPLAIDIMARELGISPIKVTKRGPGSEFVTRRTKEAS